MDDLRSEESKENKERSLQYKVVLLGDGTVGKTSICTRFAEDTFVRQYKQTIGVDFFIKRMALAGLDDVSVTVQVWDIGGQSLGSKMIGSYLSGAHAVFLVFDITNYDSFQNMEDWYKLVVQSCNDAKLPRIVLVANKYDLSHLRVVSIDLIAEFADENGLELFCMSAKNGDQVQACFLTVVSLLSGVRVDHNTDTQVIPAQIIEYQRHDPRVNGGELPSYTARRPLGGCRVS